ncbi:MAG: hypothetical protein ACFCD0_20160, partial [Gemmataceae bacterium]
MSLESTAYPLSETSDRVALPVANAAPLDCSAARPEDGPCPVCPHLLEQFEPYRRAAYWEAMH